MVGRPRVTQSDARLGGMMLSVVKQSWAGVLGGPPADGSAYALEKARQFRFATERQPAPIDQAGWYATVLGLIAHDHLKLLESALINYSNGTGDCPVTSVDTATRVSLEALARQGWLCDPTLDLRTRYRRYLCLETMSARAGWAMLHEGEEHAKNPELIAICADAEAHQIPSDIKGLWVGVEEPKDVELVELLLSRLCRYVENDLTSEDGARFGKLMYRQLSGGVHSNVNHVLGAMVHSGEVTQDGATISTYGLTGALLWQCIATLMMATFTARYEYATWGGFAVPDETRRVHLHHIRHSRQKFHQAMQAQLTT